MFTYKTLTELLAAKAYEWPLEGAQISAYFKATTADVRLDLNDSLWHKCYNWQNKATLNQSIREKGKKTTGIESR